MSTTQYEGRRRVGWLAGAIAGLAIAAAGYLVISSVEAKASDLASIGSATFQLFKNDRPICTAELVQSGDDKDVLLTAAHCVVDASQKPDTKALFAIKQSLVDDKLDPLSDQVHYLTLGTVSVARDVAIFTTRDPKTADLGDAMDIASNKEAGTLKLGTPVVAIGYPIVDGDDKSVLSMTQGLYTAKVHSPWAQMTTLFMRTTVNVTGGSSGGGLYAEFGGEWKLVGTTTGGFGAVDWDNLFTPTENVNWVLNRKDPEAARATDEIIKAEINKPAATK